jgi:hypothetical protein
VLARRKALTGMSQEAELDGEAEAVRCTAFGPDEGQVVRAKDVVPRHLGAIDRNGEQAIALLGGQKGSDGQNSLVAKRGRPFIIYLPFNAILQQGIERLLPRICRDNETRSQTTVCES